MQSPTCTNVRIRSALDVHRIFYAVSLGILPMIARRLDARERDALCSGCCYAWEDRGPHAITGLGIERFTEGRHWSPSRIRDEFLFYYEKWEPPKHRNSSSDCDDPPPPPRDWDPLVKQTYSVWFQSEQGRRKWHLTAYFTQATVDRLGTVDDIPSVRDLVVPDGLFRSSRINKSKRSSAVAATAAATSESVPSAAPSQAPPPSQTATAGPASGRSFPSYPPAPQTYAPVPQSQGFGYAPAQGEAGPSRLRHSPSPPAAAPPAYVFPDDPAFAAFYAPPPADYPPPAYNWAYGLPPAQLADHIPRAAFSFAPPAYPPAFAPYYPPPAEPPRAYAAPSPAPSSHSSSGSAWPASGSGSGSPAPAPADADGLEESSLAPLHVLKRHHPYRRDPADDRALQILTSRRA